MLFWDVHSKSDQLAFGAAWTALGQGDVAASLEALSHTSNGSGRAVYNRRSSYSSEKIKITKFLLEYGYPELQQVPQSVKWNFALVSAWKSLLSALPRQGKWVDPLAAILGTEYVLELDTESMAKAIYGEGEYKGENFANLPVAYEKRKSFFPELDPLSSLSLSARTVFTHAMRNVSRSALTSCQRIGPLCASQTKGGLIKLAEAGLIDPEPSPTHLLMNHTLKTLKQYAFDHGIKARGPKHRLVEAIVDLVAPEEIVNLLSGMGKHIRLLVMNLPLFKKHIWSETDRLEFYRSWITKVRCLGTEQPKEQAARQLPADVDLQPWMRSNENPEAYLAHSWNQTEIRLVRRIWDSRCDDILQELADKYAWDAPWFIRDTIVAYLLPDQIEAFKKSCEKHETHVWSNVLMYYGQARMAQLGVKTRQPRTLKCKGCGKRFLESSVHINKAKRVGYRIYFCRSCYRRALDGIGLGEVSMRQETMLIRLAELADALQGVPTATFVRQADFTEVSNEKQIAIVKALLAIPSYETYKQVFGSWLNALILAGILEDGTKREVFGTRCIAADGHECLSLAEKTVDDWLTANDIPHEKEVNYPHHAYLHPSGLMRADWKVGSILIEYAGLMGDPEYAAKMETKQQLASEFGLKLIIIEPKHVLNLDRKLRRLLD